MSRRTEAVLIAVIVALAAWIRFWGIGWGLPYPYHPDEGSILFHALAFGTGDLNPHWFRWPSLLMYFMFGMYGAYYLVGRAVGMFGAPVDLVRAYLADLTPFWLMGRAVSALAGVATVWVTYLFGRRAFGSAVGVSAALFLAVMFLHVRDSHYATPDVVTTFLVALSLLLALRAGASGRARDLVASGLLAGLAASAKYPGVLALVGTVTAFALLVRQGRIRFWTLPAAGLASLFGFVAGTPYCLLSRSEFVRDVARQFSMVSQTGTAQEASSYWEGLREIFVATLGRGVGYPIVALAVVGALGGTAFVVGRGARFERGSPAASQHAASGRAIAVAYAASVLLVMSLLTVKRSTYLTPALPAVAILAAVGVRRVVKAAARVAPAGGGAFTVVLVSLAALATAVPAIRYDRALAEPDTRTRAKEWIEANLEPGTRIAVETYCPVLNPTIGELRAIADRASTAVDSWQGPKKQLYELRIDAGAERHPQFEVYGIGWGDSPYALPDASEAPAALADAVDSLSIEYVVLSSKAQSARPMTGAQDPPRAAPAAFQRWLSRNATLAASFAREPGMTVIDRGPGRSFHDPVIEVYRIRQGGRSGPLALRDESSGESER